MSSLPQAIVVVHVLDPAGSAGLVGKVDSGFARAGMELGFQSLIEVGESCGLCLPHKHVGLLCTRPLFTRRIL